MVAVCHAGAPDGLQTLCFHLYHPVLQSTPLIRKSSTPAAHRLPVEPSAYPSPVITVTYSPSADDTASESTASGNIREVPIRQIPLAEPFSRADAEISGMAWHAGELILLPQYPERFGDGQTGGGVRHPAGGYPGVSGRVVSRTAGARRVDLHRAGHKRAPAGF